MFSSLIYSFFRACSIFFLFFTVVSLSYSDKNYCFEKENTSNQPNIANLPATTLSKKRNWTPICDQIGTLQEASFKANGENFTIQRIIGDPKSKCAGRCGTGCFQAMQKVNRRYTQECFNHDMCHRIVGTIFGECADEFWAAVNGYSSALSCPFVANGTWHIRKQWYCDLKMEHEYWQLNNDNSVWADDQSIGKWNFDSTINLLTINLDNGKIYTAKSDHTGHKIEGTIWQEGTNACWYATLVTFK